MACSRPIHLINPHYKKLAREASSNVYEYAYMEDFYLTVPCGHCKRCLNKRQQNWFNRANYMYRNMRLRPEDCYFCTFTFDPATPQYKEAVKEPYKPLRRFIDRMRKYYFNKTGKKLKFPYFFVVEFADGKTARKRGRKSMHLMHFHAIFFACPLSRFEVSEQWRSINGRCDVQELRSEAGVRYTMKYITKDCPALQFILGPADLRNNGKFFCSHGFGKLSDEDIKKYRKFMLLNSKNFFCNSINNYPYSIPKYWKERCFSKQEIKDLHRALLPPILLEGIVRDHPDWPKDKCYAFLILSLPPSWFFDDMPSAEDQNIVYMSLQREEFVKLFKMNMYYGSDVPF